MTGEPPPPDAWAAAGPAATSTTDTAAAAPAAKAVRSLLAAMVVVVGWDTSGGYDGWREAGGGGWAGGTEVGGERGEYGYRARGDWGNNVGDVATTGAETVAGLGRVALGVTEERPGDGGRHKNEWPLRGPTMRARHSRWDGPGLEDTLAQMGVHGGRHGDAQGRKRAHGQPPLPPAPCPLAEPAVSDDRARGRSPYVSTELASAGGGGGVEQKQNEESGELTGWWGPSCGCHPDSCGRHGAARTTAVGPQLAVDWWRGATPRRGSAKPPSDGRRFATRPASLPLTRGATGERPSGDLNGEKRPTGHSVRFDLQARSCVSGPRTTVVREELANTVRGGGQCPHREARRGWEGSHQIKTIRSVSLTPNSERTDNTELY